MFNQLQSEKINELACALCHAQGMMESAVKDSTNPFFKSKYADLTSVWAVAKGPLHSNGLAVAQQFIYEGATTILVTTLTHSSGQWMRSFLPIIVTKDDVQGMGAGITYMRRYALTSMLGITQDDDDAESAVIHKISEKQYVELDGILRQCSQDVQNKFNKGLQDRGIKSLKFLPAKDYDRIKTYLISQINSNPSDRIQSIESGMEDFS